MGLGLTPSLERAQRPKIMKVSPFERRGFDLLLLIYNRGRKVSDEEQSQRSRWIVELKISLEFHAVELFHM